VTVNDLEGIVIGPKLAQVLVDAMEEGCRACLGGAHIKDALDDDVKQRAVGPHYIGEGVAICAALDRLTEALTDASGTGLAERIRQWAWAVGQ
jgi:hypothetical protein